MSKQPKKVGMTKAKLELCVATYHAQQVGHTLIVSGVGAHPTSGYDEFFEQSPIDVFPPEFTLWHRIPSGPVLDVITPFSVSTHFASSAPVRKVIVHDSNGSHNVEVTQASDAVHHHVLTSHLPARKKKQVGVTRRAPALLVASSALVTGCVQVWIKLKPILMSWSSAGSVFPNDTLEPMWRQSPKGDKPYDPEGINALIDAIQADSFFSPCPQAQGLTLGFFQTGGEIQTAGDLLNHLCPCGD
jgi:hypothetical protein